MAHRRLVLVSCLSLLIVPATRGQAPQRQATELMGTGLIVGQVVDADTGRGVGGALVVLSPPAPTSSAIGELTEMRAPLATLTQTPNVKRTLTSTDGRFLFRGLPKGRFSITASAPSHLSGAFGQLRPYGPAQTLDLLDGEKRAGLKLLVWRFGSISGTVRDDYGEPAAGIGVECFRRVFTGGQKRLASMGTAIYTDDRGAYRVPSLPPGDYVCGTVQNLLTVPMSVASADALADGRGGSAGPTPESMRISNSGAVASSTGMRIGDLAFNSGASAMRGAVLPPPDANGRLMAFVPQYYAGSTTSSQATLIALKPGEERGGIDLQLKLVPAVRISGLLSSPTGIASFLGLRLVPVSGSDMASEGQAEFARTSSDPTGAFTFLGIPAGQYVLKCRLYPRPAPGGNLQAAFDETSLWTATPVTVGDKDITNLAITLRAGIRASGRVEFSGTRPQPAPVEIQRVSVRLQMAEGRTSSPISLDGRVLADSTFKTAGYAAGRYIANVLANTIPAGWSVKSITLNGRDVSVEPMDLVEGDITGLVVMFTDKTTTLSGTVTGAKGPDGMTEVVVFPADSMAWKEIGVVARRSRVERTTEAGTFSIVGLPPGDYFVAAVAGSLPGDRQDPSLLATLVRDASRVTLPDGGTVTVQLTVKR